MNLKDLYPYIKPAARGVPNPAIDVELVAAAVEFAMHSQLLRRTIQLDAQANWGDYEFDLEEGDVLIMVKSVCVNGVRLDPLDAAPCTGSSVSYDSCAPCAGEPANGYRVPCPGRLLIYPTPCTDIRDGIQIEASVSPSRMSCDIPAEFFERWGRVLSDGALSRLLLMPKTDWYNATLAQRYSVAFKEGKAMARAFSGALYQPSNARINYNVNRMLSE